LLVFRTKNIVKHLVNVPKDIIFYTTMIKTAYFVVRDVQKSKHFLENSKKRSGLNSLVHHVTAPIWQLIKRKKI